jgi:hypothetical protein
LPTAQRALKGAGDGERNVIVRWSRDDLHASMGGGTCCWPNDEALLANGIAGLGPPGGAASKSVLRATL